MYEEQPGRFRLGLLLRPGAHRMGQDTRLVKRTALIGNEPPIDLKDEPTWSPSIVDDLMGSLDNLRAYEAERERIDELCIENIEARLDPPINRYGSGRDRLRERIDGILADRSILGFHCDRLTDDD